MKLVVALLLAIPAHAQTLKLEDYLSQVDKGNTSSKAAALGVQSAEARVSEGEMTFAPVFFAQVQTGKDKKPSFFLPYQSFDATNYNFGISQNTRFGVKAQLSYGGGDFSYVGFRPQYYEASPRLEASWSLLRNFGGNEWEASEKIAAESAKASGYSSRFESKMTRAEAEMAYYRLALIRELKDISENSIERAQKLSDWSRRRSNLQLGDEGDFYQAEANLETKKLALLQSIELEKSAARTFNKARGLLSDVVSDTVILPELSNATYTERKGPREDLLAAQSNAEMAAASAEAGREKNKPTLELFGVYALNSKQEATMGDAFSGSFETDRPTSAVGLRFTTALFDQRKIREGYALDRQAAEMRLESRRRDQETEWQDLTTRWVDAKKRLKLAWDIEEVQKKKVLNERTRLTRGRTTTYQTLLFEQDFSIAQSQRIQTQLEIYEIFARLKTFSGDAK